MVASKIVVTPRVLAKANEITAGITDRREQARKLYEWVAGHVRYVALLFGDGGVAPHAADTILADSYGDCKDHAVLYSALLKAKGISSQPVIINATNGYFVPQVPQLLTFNHMIVWLPEFGLYADTTANSAPFGALPQFEYGKPVIRVGNGVALQHTPVLQEADSTVFVFDRSSFRRRRQAERHASRGGDRRPFRRDAHGGEPGHHQGHRCHRGRRFAHAAAWMRRWARSRLRRPRS